MVHTKPNRKMATSMREVGCDTNNMVHASKDGTTDKKKSVIALRGAVSETAMPNPH